jgi:outer membrane phospholipase A
MGLMGKDLCKLKAQVTFDLDVTAALKLRGPEAKTLILTVTQKEEWQLYAPERSSPVVPELPFKIPGLWDPWNMSTWRLWMRIS